MTQQDRQRSLSVIRGHATSMTGLRRYRTRRGPADWGERNWLINHPVQATAADIFKTTGIRLDRLYPEYGAKLIIPLHDAFIFEAPLEQLEEVAKLTEWVMVDEVKEYFPELWPRVELNLSRPDCWNKDGQAESLEQWLSGKN